MSNDVVDQIRQLAEAYDEHIDDISIDEIVGRATEPPELEDGRWTEANVQYPASRLRHRLAFAAAAVLLIAGVAGALALAGRDGSGRGDPADVLGVPTTTAIEGEGSADPPYGPLDYATTEHPLLLWPNATVSDPPATTTGYGMRVCDGGWGTKILRVDPATGPAHTYSGTLCLFINLTTPRPDAVTTCAASTDQFNYARCQRRTDKTPTAGAGAAAPTIATPEQRDELAAFPTATSSDQARPFSVEIAAAAEQRSTVTYGDNGVEVTLTREADGVDPQGVCYLINMPGATADGCAGHDLLATGLAYGAFKDGDGPIEIVGIVPDEVTAVEIDGTTVTPSNNVWRYTATTETALKITVRSADGRTASTS